MDTTTTTSPSRLFLDTRAESPDPTPLRAGTAHPDDPDATLHRGLRLALTRMQPGEASTWHIQASHAYGATGSFSFPFVPPNATLQVDIDLVDAGGDKGTGEEENEDDIGAGKSSLAIMTRS